MKITWMHYAFVFLMILATGAALMVVSHRVQRAENKIAKIDRAILAEQENIRILEAEWSYLNNPERLEMLASKYLDLSASEPETLVSHLSKVVPDVYVYEHQDLAKAYDLGPEDASPVALVALRGKPVRAGDVQR